MELLVSGDEHADADQQSGQLGGCHGQPDAINAQQERQQQNRRHLEQQGAQERDECTGHTVAQGREEGSTVEEINKTNEISTDLETYSKELLTKLIMGEKSLDDWDSYIQDLKDLGLDDLIAVQQARVDRAMK